MTMGGRWGTLLAIGGIALAYSSGARAQSCEPAAASVISLQGDVEVSGHDRAHWRDLQLNQVLCAGQQVRLMAKSRAVLRLPNETLLRLDEGSVLTLQPVEPDKPAWLDLLRGALHIISRVPRALNIRTPFVNAGIEGTEFALQVGSAETALWVYEGRVRFSNTLGQLLVASGEAAAAAPGRAPERRIVIKPRQAVEWALYYPPLLDSRPETYPEALRPAVLAYRRNDLTAAFASLDRVPKGARDARYHTLRAGLLLSVGRVPEAEGELTSAQRLDPKNGTAYALLSVIAVVRNEQEEALKLSAEAVRLAPGSATPYVARSYAEQSAFEIEKAHQSLQQASRLAPEDALVWARLAELELSRGDLDAALTAATKAETLDPDLARTQTVLGFAYLTRIEIDEARAAFDRAIARDPADPLPRLGLGLAKIRDGDVDEGTKEIEIAASLDPNNSLVRSYLGKAYYEQKRGGLAETEFEQAKLLDPKDPTPWFYDAIQKQTTNRPVEALHDLQKAIDLNDNRAVYRSRLLLDQDLAARSAALGRIYRDLGFEQRALVEGWRSVNTDPTDYSGHRLLADSYSTLPRHGIARVSELLQSQLLQPINITPVQPSLAESDLLILEGEGPSASAFNEFNPLFLRNRFTLQTSAVFGGDDTVGDEVTHSGLWNGFSYSLGQFHFDTDGFRNNNGIKRDVYNAFIQASLSPTTSAQIELRHSDTEEEDRAFRFFPEEFNPDRRSAREIDTARFGFHHTFTPASEIIGSLIFADVIGKFKDPDEITLGPGFDIAAPREARLEEDSYVIEGQHLFRSDRFKLTSGFGYFTTTQREIIVTLFDPSFLDPIITNNDIERGNVYSYSHLLLPYDINLTLGVSADFYEADGETIKLVNPKVGLTWSPFPGTTFRAAWFRSLEPGQNTVQTIEPTQVAGFNQFFGNTFEQDFVGAFFPGIRTWRYGAGLDQAIGTDLLTGIEYTERDLTVPGIGFEEDWDEYFGRAYLYWTPHPLFAASAEYQYERFERGDLLGAGTGFRTVETHRIPLGINVFHSSGFRFGLGASYVDQRGRFVPRVFLDPAGELGNDRFWVLDAEIGYRLPHRFGLITVGIRNLLDEDFNFQETDPSQPTLAKGQLLFARLTLAF